MLAAVQPKRSHIARLAVDSMCRYVISPAAERDMQSILEWTHERFGQQGRLRYEALLVSAIVDVADDPKPPAARPVQRSPRPHEPIIFGTAETACNRPVTEFVARDTSCSIESATIAESKSGVYSTNAWILHDIFPMTTGPEPPAGSPSHRSAWIDRVDHRTANWLGTVFFGHLPCYANRRSTPAWKISYARAWHEKLRDLVRCAFRNGGDRFQRGSQATAEGTHGGPGRRREDGDGPDPGGRVHDGLARFGQGC